MQNLGDGTFFHSGSLAIRAAVAAGVDITYKLLYNGTVAMTGGQDPQGQMAVPEVVQSLLLEGVARVIVTSDDPGKWDDADFGPLADGRVEVRDRTMLMESQVELAAVPGVTVLVHDQRCAAELRRDRSRGIVEKPDWRVVINERVCEGCGDCGDKSNCLSVQPIDTAYGRKTRIHQTSCNFDTSCLQGDCPAFAIVTLDAEGLKAAKPATGTTGDPSAGLPDPVPEVPSDAFTVRFSGIGGTGVITVSQVLGTAAMLDGYVVRGLDQTGLSQKAGPVVSDLRLSRGDVPASNHANSSGVDCLMAFDLLVAASDTHRVGADTSRTIVVGFGGVVTDRVDGRPPDHGVPASSPPSPVASTRCRAPPTTATSTPRPSSPGCSATPPPPTSSCSASPCRPAPSPSTRPPSSGRSSSTASPSSATWPPSGGVGAGSSPRPRSRRPPGCPGSCSRRRPTS